MAEKMPNTYQDGINKLKRLVPLALDKLEYILKNSESERESLKAISLVLDRTFAKLVTDPSPTKQIEFVIKDNKK